MTVYPPPCSGGPVAERALRIFPARQTSLFFLKQARIIGTDGVVISSDNQVFSEFTYVDSPNGIGSHSIFRRRRFPKPQQLEGCYATLTYPSSGAYAHWIVESLPRIRLLKPYLSSLHGVFVPAGLPETMLDSLSTFGIEREKLVPLNMSSHYAPHHLLVPMYCAGLDIPSWVSEFLRNGVFGPSSPAPSRRLYVSRARTGRRRLLNEEELLPVLHKWNFDIVHPQELQFVDQARLFHEAEVVIGPSGAGLFTALFCQPGSTLIEIPPHEELACHYYYSVASAAGMKYWHVKGTRPVEHSGMLDHSDFYADPTALEEVIANALQRSEGTPH